MWQALDWIVAISEDAKKSFLKVFPELKNKVIVIENIISPDFIRAEAVVDVSTEIPYAAGVTNLCSIGRFCYPKNFESIPEIVLRLNELGIRIRWYLIGFGGGEDLIREKIEKAALEDQVMILGKKTNPYPYIKACDIYVQPSRYEGKAVAVREAQILGKPVLITDFPTAKSQLEDGVDGLICPLSIEGVADGIKALVEDKALRDKLAQTAAARDYSNRDEVNKIYRLVG
jgi:glycosyltransferase involved in cell wall biosynthesis